MNLRELGFGALFSLSIPPTAAGTTEIDGTAVDMVGGSGGPFESLTVICTLGALTATQVTVLKLQGSNDNSTGWTDLAGSHQGPPADADSNKLLVIDAYRINSHRYVRPVVVRGTANAVISSVVCIAYNCHSYPIPTQDSTVSTPTSSGGSTTPAPVNVIRYVVAGTA